jgi:hypothetical protein
MKALVTSGFMGRLAGFGRPSGFKPLFVLFGLFFFQQFSGVYITLFYSVELFKVPNSICTLKLWIEFLTSFNFIIRCLLLAPDRNLKLEDHPLSAVFIQ